MEKELKKDSMMFADELSAKIANQYRDEVINGQKTVEEFLNELKSEVENILLHSFGDADEKEIYQFFGKFVINLLSEFNLIS